MLRDTRSFFKTLIDHEVTVELKNDIQLRGTLKSVDQYLNIKLDDIQVVDELKYPHLVSTVTLPPSPPPSLSLLKQSRLYAKPPLQRIPTSFYYIYVYIYLSVMTSK